MNEGTCSCRVSTYLMEDFDQRFDQPDVLLTRNPENVGNTLVLQALNDQFGDGGTRLLSHDN